MFWNEELPVLIEGSFPWFF